ncbi:hypothetical protein LINGRAHAP2_LOCUS17575, partial [Linum grandiflorum]
FAGCWPLLIPKQLFSYSPRLARLRIAIRRRCWLFGNSASETGWWSSGIPSVKLIRPQTIWQVEGVISRLVFIRFLFSDPLLSHFILFDSLGLTESCHIMNKS